MGKQSDQTSTSDFTAASRDALVEALLAAGPGKPTLCDGWKSEHLAAHIVLRESSPLVVGLVLRPLARTLERRTMALGDSASSPQAYQELVSRIAAGPQPPKKLSQLSGVSRLQNHPRTARLSATIQNSPAARRAAQASNLLEFFVHTEDLRRAQHRWAPRHLADAYADALFNEIARRARLMYRGESTGIVLARSAGHRVVDRVVARKAADGQQTRTIAGPAGELVMHAFGRRDNALVLVD
ncbi:maleylpyruvate isomerase family mycothiol-dependent enzyme [Citricoccus sp. GCM10030269]|uniref:maleylpyruvate isomerase family mycothiol-dependent enzyme n=1 Tax=Citricoccus sp. GCM10030269 TaxID=3273388 RepID=UPI00360DC19F